MFSGVAPMHTNFRKSNGQSLPGEGLLALIKATVDMTGIKQVGATALENVRAMEHPIAYEGCLDFGPDSDRYTAFLLEEEGKTPVVLWGEKVNDRTLVWFVQ